MKLKRHQKEPGMEDHICDMLTVRGHKVSNTSELEGAYDKERALLLTDALAFIKVSQKDAWKKLLKVRGEKIATASLRDALAEALDARGTLAVLREGIQVAGERFDLSYRKPIFAEAQGKVRYAANIVHTVRQLRYSVSGSQQSIDLVTFLNGIPVITAEIKSDTTQSIEDAEQQYRQARLPRDPRSGRMEPLLTPIRGAITHFAVSGLLASMTTCLAGDKTEFLPFNRGRSDGVGGQEAGNDITEDCYGTEYLWSDIWARESLLDLTHNFAFKQQSRTREGSVVFPRYHQIDAVRRLCGAILLEKVGGSYLVENSAGSGKSYTIGWLAFKLLHLVVGGDRPLFDSIVVLTDRRILDNQLQSMFDEVVQKKSESVVCKITKSATELREAIESGKKIIVSTIQKFPHIVDDLKDQSKKRFCIIIDEAHSSQTGAMAQTVRKTMGNTEPEILEDEETDEDIVNTTMSTAGRPSNITFIAFTATPKRKTLEIFGRKNDRGGYEPFHLYSMKQAIGEGHILNVLKNLEFPATRRRLEHEGPDEYVSEVAAGRAANRSVYDAPLVIARKTEYILNDFHTKSSKAIGGRAKAMIVAGSRVAAKRYLEFFKQLCEKNSYPYKALVAFSGSVYDKESPDAGEATEQSLNAIGNQDIAEAFAKDEYRFLIVASKFQTGFNQPLLHTMYVDQPLNDTKAVQTLSRLNRRYPGKPDTRVVDFANSPEQIEGAFRPYYGAISLARGTKPESLSALRSRLDALAVYEQADLDKIAKAPSLTQPQIVALIDRLRRRYQSLSQESQLTFRRCAAEYCSNFLVLAFRGADVSKAQEDFSEVCKWLRDHVAFSASFGGFGNMADGLSVTHAKIEDPIAVVDIEYKGNKTSKLRAASLSTRIPMPPETFPISELVRRLNELYSLGLTEDDNRTAVMIHGKLEKDSTLKYEAKNNSIGHFRIGNAPDKIRKELTVASKADGRRIDTSYRASATKILQDDDLLGLFTYELSTSLWHGIRSARAGSKVEARV